MVGGGIARGVSFGLDDAAGEPGAGEFPDYDFADEEAGQCQGVRWQLSAPETAR